MTRFEIAVQIVPKVFLIGVAMFAVLYFLEWRYFTKRNGETSNREADPWHDPWTPREN
jgi:hypothetical protein